MEFLWPFMLWLLVLIPVLVLAYILAQRRRQRFALRYASLSLVKEAMGKGPGIRRHIPVIFFLLGLTAMIVALARPVAIVKLPSAEGTIILLMDTSGSMAADDVKPTRMDAAKEAARAFVQKEPSTVRIGVVSFSDNAFVVQAPTNDQDAVTTAINRLYPQRGTAIGRGLVASFNSLFDAVPGDQNAAGRNPNGGNQFGGNQFGGSPFGGNQFGGASPMDSLNAIPTPAPGEAADNTSIIILLTDGENNQGPEPADVADQVAQRGVRIYTVGIGSPEGSVLNIQGRSIRTRLDEDLLKQVAETAGGQYYNAQNETDLENIYKNLGTKLVLKTEKTEVTAGLTGLAAALSIIGSILSLLWFNRLP